MNQHGAEQGGQQGQDSHLSFLFNANGQNPLMGYPGAGAGVIAGAPGFRYGVNDASLEEQILQRATALRAEALMQQQQQQQHQRHHQLSAALAALQQQQQLSSLASLHPNIAALSAQEQEALLGRAAALRELGIAGAGVPAAGLHGAAAAAGGMERLQQLEFGRLEEFERRRQQLAALANLSNPARPPETAQAGAAEQLNQDSARSEQVAVEKEAICPPAPPPGAASAAEKSKDDLRKTPGTVIVPCRARGMPMDHNFKTAYFVISEDAKHGEDLVCSYFACRNGGVKFRYCAHCMAPVAKRNFCRRHDHGMSAKTGAAPDNNDDEDDGSLDQSEATPQKEEAESAPSQAKKEKAAAAPPAAAAVEKEPPKPEKDAGRSSLDVLSKAASSSFMIQDGSKPEGQAKRKKPSEDAEKKPAAGVSRDDVLPDQSADAAEYANISTKRRKMWSALLVKRPRTKDPRHLSSWLNEVLTVSDFETPLEQSENSESKSSFGHDSAVAPEKVKSSKEKSSSKEKKSDKEKKKRKLESKSSDDGPPSSKSKKDKDKDEKSGKTKKESDSSTSDKKPPKKSLPKDSPAKRESEDGFVGSFADWRDRKKEKALSKKGNGSLRK